MGAAIRGRIGVLRHRVACPGDRQVVLPTPRQRWLKRDARGSLERPA